MLVKPKWQYRGKCAYITGEKNRVPDHGFYPTDFGICSIKCFTIHLGTLTTFDGTDPKVDRVKPKVRNTICSPVYILGNHSTDDMQIKLQIYYLIPLGVKLDDKNCIIGWPELIRDMRGGGFPGTQGSPPPPPQPQVGLLSTQRLRNAGAILIFSHPQRLTAFTFAIGSGSLR